MMEGEWGKLCVYASLILTVVAMGEASMFGSYSAVGESDSLIECMCVCMCGNINDNSVAQRERK